MVEIKGLTILLNELCFGHEPGAYAHTINNMHHIGTQCCDETGQIINCFRVAMFCVQPKTLDGDTSGTPT